MSNLSLLLKEGAVALKQGDYTTAIASLKEFCESPVPAESQAYLQGHKWLVQAYVKEQETELALEICLKMAQSQAPAAEQWATQAIPKLQQALAQQPKIQQPKVQPSETLDAAASTSPSEAVSEPGLTTAKSDHASTNTGASTNAAPSTNRDASRDEPNDSPIDGAAAAEDSARAPEQNVPKQNVPEQNAPELTPEDIKQAIDQAVKAFRRGNNREVIEQLEPLGNSLDPQSSNYGRAQMTLAKAYKAEEETEKAIALAQTLMASDRDDISIWGKQFLNNLGPGAIADRPKNEATKEVEAAASLPDTTQPSENLAEDLADSPVPLDSPQPTRQPNEPKPSISGIPYQTPRVANHSNAALATTPRSRSTASPQVVSQRAPNDYTPVIQSAMSHGSITFIVSWLMYWLLPHSLAFCFDMLRLAVPVIIYCTATDPIAKINAKEATNYVITSLLIMVLVFGGGIFFGLGVLALGMLMGPLILLLSLPLITYGLVMAFYPVVGTIMCLANPDKTFHYPRWLIWHAI